MLVCNILKSEDEVVDLANAWRELYARVGFNFFSDYDPLYIWWKTVAQLSGMTMSVVVGWRDGRVVTC